MAGRILIVDGVATNRIVLRLRLAAARYETIEAANAREALRLVSEDVPDLILLDRTLPDADAISICQQLKAETATAGIPVIILTSSTDRQERIAALRAGADEIYAKPFDETVLLARIRSLLRARNAAEDLRQRDATCRELGFAEPVTAFRHQTTIALVGATSDTTGAWGAALAPFLHRERLLPCTREEALAAASEEPAPDAFVIAADLTRPSEGLRLMSDLRSRPGTRHSAICIVAAPQAIETAVVALDLGAADVLPDTFAAPDVAEEIALRLRMRIAEKSSLDVQRAQISDGLRLAAIDPLTGLYNRRYLLPRLERMARLSSQGGPGFAIMEIDIDRFKTVNDTLGHSAGDMVLIELARRLQSHLRPVDILARLGGEEFVIVLPETDLAAAGRVAETLRSAVGDCPFPLPALGSVSITISIGLAATTASARRETAGELIRQADMALMSSKNEGRNRVKISRQPAA